MKHPILAVFLAMQCALLPLPLKAAASFFVGVAGGYSDHPSLFYFDGSSGELTPHKISLGVAESIDGLAIETGADAYLSANTLGYGSVVRLDGSTFVPHDRSGGLTVPMGSTFGPDGNLYVSSLVFPGAGDWQGRVMRYNGATGAFIDTFIAPGSGGLSVSNTLEFHDGSLFVSDAEGGVLRFDDQSGSFEGTFVAPGNGGLGSSQYMTFGPSGDLYIGDAGPGQRVLRFDGNTGAFIGTFVEQGSGGLTEPGGLDFGQDGDLYVVDTNNDRVLRYEGRTGSFLGVAVDLVGPEPSITPTYLVATPIPEPTVWMLMVSGLAAMGLYARNQGRPRALDS